MACPDPIVIAELKKPDGDPEVLRHLQECPACWLDWHIVHGARCALYPPGEVRHDLNQHVMARIARRARQLERPTNGWELCVSAILVSAATGAFLFARLSDTSVAPISAVLGCAVATAIVSALFVWRQEANQRSSPSGAS